MTEPPDDPQALVAHMRAKADELEAVAKEAAGKVERLRAAADALEGRLTDDTRPRIVRSMDVDTRGMAAGVKRGAARATRKHPAQERFYAAGKTVTDVAVELRETRARVSSWMADGDGNRPIPRRHADYLKQTYRVPLSAWKRIAE